MQVKLDHVTKEFVGKTIAINDFSATIKEGQLVALLGPSGCGKSTMLYCLSGIYDVSGGRIYFDDKDVTDLSPDQRNIGLVFQNYALYPHMTVLENICFPLEIQKVEKNERIRRATEMAKLVHIDEYLDRKPSQLSGGQQQRVAIARALVKRPQLLLLDEPLSNLDARLRIEMREEIRRIQQETGVTTVFVTHDQEEAMSISDEIFLMKKGVKQQIAAPQEMYDDPANCFVADFLGNPPINKVAGYIKDGKFVTEDGSFTVTWKKLAGIEEGRHVHLSMRSESIDKAAKDSEVVMQAKVTNVYTMGKEILYYIQMGSQHVRAYIDPDYEVKKDDVIDCTFKKKGVFVFDFETGERLV